MAGCAKVYVRTGLYYRMQSGDSLTSLARTYGVTVQELAEINDIEDSKDLKPGDRVFIPTRARKTKTVKPLAKGVAEEKIVFDRGRFAWPIHGRLTSRFGMRNGTRHDGIDIASPHGTPIHAASAGQVVYSQRLRGYGHLILVKHKDGFFTAYAHLSQYLVKKGKRVKKGQVIGKVGATGRATGPHLHFEVRKGRVARNPLFFLPKL
ncbi:MAG: peptidoglycan DD-metalloendopeptidase family protein [Deltaproteobacteria bacterium]|nr:peptidoglycan DD-metalloendopeptidase family protein [Deltaproteobacteria bacterium]